MATKANKQAFENVKDAERRAKRKLRRLQKKGVRTGSINPLKAYDPSDTRAMNKYAKELEQFISRQNRIVAGYDGSPVKYKEFRELKSYVTKYNTQQKKLWNKLGLQPFMTPDGISEQKMAERAELLEGGLPTIRKPSYELTVNPEQLKGSKDIQNRIAILKRQTSPAGQKKRLKQARKSMSEWAGKFDEGLARSVRAMTNDQLMVLMNQSDFATLLYSLYPEDTDDLLSVFSHMERQKTLEHLHRLIELAKQEAPRGTATVGQRIHKEALKRARNYIKANPEQAQNKKAIQQNIEVNLRDKISKMATEKNVSKMSITQMMEKIK